MFYTVQQRCKHLSCLLLTFNRYNNLSVLCTYSECFEDSALREECLKWVWERDYMCSKLELALIALGSIQESTLLNQELT